MGPKGNFISQKYRKPILPILLHGEEFPILIDSQFDDVSKTKSLPEPSFYRRLRKEVYGDDDDTGGSNESTGDESDNTSWGIGSGSWVVGASVLIAILALTVHRTASLRR